MPRIRRRRVSDATGLGIAPRSGHPARRRPHAERAALVAAQGRGHGVADLPELLPHRSLRSFRPGDHERRDALEVAVRRDRRWPHRYARPQRERTVHHLEIHRTSVLSSSQRHAGPWSAGRWDLPRGSSGFPRRGAATVPDAVRGRGAVCGRFDSIPRIPDPRRGCPRQAASRSIFRGKRRRPTG